MKNYTCSVDGCDKPSAHKLVCPMHRWRMKTYGSYDLPANRPRKQVAVKPALEKFEERIARGEGCWEWQGSINVQGYGMFYHRNTKTYAHRAAYERFVGPIPDGMLIDHACHNAKCVNPAHLRPVNKKQNAENFSGLSGHNTSGVRGVFWHAGAQKWQVQVGHNGVRHYGGLHLKLKDAEAAAIEMRNQMHTHNDLDRLPA